MIATGAKLAISVLLFLVASHSVGIIVVWILEPREVVIPNNAAGDAFEKQNSKNTPQDNGPHPDQSGKAFIDVPTRMRRVEATSSERTSTVRSL